MCLGGSSTPQDNSAQIAREQATEREGKITTGKQSIDQAFNVFDPAFYDKYTKAYTDNYNPEVDRQFGEAKQGLTYDTARRGTTDSTGAQKQFGDLTRTYEDARQQIGSQAVDATNKLKSSVDATKGDLYAQNSASADPSLAALQATTRAGSLTTPGAYSPLGTIFASAANTGASYLNGSNSRIPAGYAGAFAPGASLPSGGSGRVVS